MMRLEKLTIRLDVYYIYLIPGGPVIDRMAKEGKHTYALPLPMNDESYNFSFSGLKSAVINLCHNASQRGEEIIPQDLACSFQEVAVDVLVF